VGTPTWSQDVDVASQDPIMGTNIAYTLHFYAGTHGQSLRDKAMTAMNNGIALMVTEWGAVNADGDGAVAEASSNEWMAFLKQHNLTHLNWAVSDKSEGASIINPGADPNGNWTASDLTASGSYVKGVISNWNGDLGQPTPTPEPDTPPTEGKTSCEHLITNTWSGGFQGTIRITNNSNNTINGWTVNWSYSDGTTILQS
jgi:aryl-phospho-beta-D-glucosidase BglC (GH1 family)